MKKKSMLRLILDDIKSINDYEAKKSKDPLWDGSLSYSGVKRLIYMIWHDGFNETQTDLIENAVDKKAQRMYKELINRYKDTEEIKVRF